MKNIKRSDKVKERNRFLAFGRLAVLSAFLLLFIPGYSQSPLTNTVFMDWSTTTGSQNMFQRSVTRSVPGTTNVVVAGATLNSNGNYDILVQKLNGSGTVLWTAQYNGAGNGNDIATDIRVASNGEIYVCGTYYKDVTDSSNAIVIKYDGSGNQRWTATYNGSGSRNDGYTSLLVSGASVVAVGACWSTSNQYDMLTRRLDTAGTTVWTTTYDQAGLADGAVSLANRSGSIFVTGGVQTSSTAYKIATWKLNPTTGAITTTTLSSASSIAIDRVNDVQEDASGNVYVVGTVYNSPNGFDFKIFKYDASLSLLWSHTWNGAASLDDGITGLALDQNGSVIVTGYTGTATGNDFATVKYSSAGVQQWASTYDNGGRDSATCIVVNQTDTNKIYVSGYSFNGATNDYWTMRYNGAGVAQWKIGFNSLHNANDIATAIALDTLNNIIVTGQNEISPGTRTYTTLRYVEKNVFAVADTASAYNVFLFAENKGQLLNTNGDSIPEMRYYNSLTSIPAVYFSDTSVSYVFARGDSAASSPDSTARVDMKFLSQNSGKIRAYNLDSAYLNFFYPHIPDGRSRCQQYHQLYFPDIYNNVDVEYSSNMTGLKTFFIVKPSGGGNPVTAIDMKFEGADSVKVLANGHLVVYTKLGNLDYPKPAVWEIDNSSVKTNLAWQPTYNIVATNEVKFSSIGSWNSSQYLILAMDFGYTPITPMAYYNNRWSTYICGDGTCEYGLGVTASAGGASFFTGTTTSYLFPYLSGFSNTYQGLQDAYVMKFNSQNVQVWATYIGGSNVDVGYDIKLDGGNNVWIYGYSLSSDYPPQSSGTQYTQTNLGSDPTYIITKFDPTGQNLLWSSYFGGTDIDWMDWGGHRLTIDANDNVYICGMTRSDASEGFPIHSMSGAYNQTTFGGGNQDGFIAEFDNTGHQLWTTYVGGSGDDDVEAVSYNTSASVLYAAGYTSSSSAHLTCGTPLTGYFPICSGGGFNQTNYGGGSYDAFLMKYDASNVLTWSTYFGGSGDESVHIEVATDGNDVFLLGSTTTTTGSTTCGTPTAGTLALCHPSSSTFQSSNAGGVDMFISRFDVSTDGMIWSTFYGGTGDDYPARGVLTPSGNLYWGGYTIHGGFPTVNPGNNFYTQANNADGSGNTGDGLVMNEKNNAIVWATHYGGYFSPVLGCSGDQEIVHSVAYEPSGKLYITGCARSVSDVQVKWPYRCGNPQYCWNTTNFYNSYLQDAFVAEFDLSGNVGIDEPATNTTGTLQAFPNPSSGLLTVILPEAPVKGSELLMYDNLGQVVKHITFDQNSEKMINLDISELSSGIYFLQYNSGINVYSQKIIKQD